MSLPILDIAVKSLEAKVAIWIYKELRDFLNDTGLAQKWEKDLEAKLNAAAVGDTFLSLPVVGVDADSVLLLVRFANFQAFSLENNSADGYEPVAKPVNGIKVDLARGVVRISKDVNLTDPNRLPVTIKIESFAIQLSVERDTYGITFGGGRDNIANFTQFNVAIRWNEPTFRLNGFYADGDSGEFIIYVHANWPWPIPLGNSGLALVGVGLTYGERFAPNLTKPGEPDPLDPLDEMRKATAEDYVRWRRKPALEQWIPAKADVRVFGVDSDIGDVVSAGNILRFDKAGLAYINYGPIIFMGGTLVLLNRITLGESIGAIDVRSKSVYLSQTYGVNLAAKFSMSGSVECSAYLHDQSRTFIAIGGSTLDRAKVDIFDLLELSGGAKLVPLQGFNARASARLEGEGKLLGFGGGFSLLMEQSGRIGWNPAELGGEMGVSGSVWVKILGLSLGIGVGANLGIQVPTPLRLYLRVTGRLKLPWPLKSKSVTVTVFDLKEDTIGKVKEAIALSSVQPLPYFHWCSGTSGQIDDTENAVLPDVSFEIPFLKIAKVGPIAVNPQSGDGNYNEGGIDVQHSADSIRLLKIDDESGDEVDVAGVRVAWLGTASSGNVVRSSRLAIPCSDPVAWLQSFDYAAPESHLPIEHQVFQTFGEGPAELFPPNGGLAVFELENISISSPDAISVRAYGWLDSYPRAVAGRHLFIAAHAGRMNAGTMIEVRRFDLRFISEEGVRPDRLLFVKNGTITPVIVRRLPNSFVEWSIVVDVDDPSKPIEVRAPGDDNVTSFLLVAVGYVIESTQNYQGAPQTVLRPGRYRIKIDGQSNASFKGGAGPSTPWQYRKEFSVIPPPDLRPYLRYSTCGDERIFGVAAGGWNPNPSGIGFGHYARHLGVARAKVSYLSQIYKALWVTAEKPEPRRCVVVPNPEGTVAGSELSQKWQSEFGGGNALEEEFTFELPTRPGQYELRVYSDEYGPQIDAWSYRVSRFELPSDHLTPVKTPPFVYGPYGCRPLASMTLAKPFPDLTKLQKALLTAGGALPAWLQDEKTLADPDSSLSFLRAFEWIGFFSADPVSLGRRLFSPPGAAEFCLVNDASDRPVAFLYRTSEPVDWRRITISIAQGNEDDFERLFTTRLASSPDGCSCLVFLEAEKVMVRVPKGTYAVRVDFKYVVTGLPTLIDRQIRTSTGDYITFMFGEPLGQPWPSSIAGSSGVR